MLAYSTVSQLGYMMLALGAGGWVAGLFHLVTHAFFKSLLFLCSGSVIHAVHTNEMPQMGGLRHKMPWTAYTMLVGCLAIAGCVGFSGFYSKDSIIAQTLAFRDSNPAWAFPFYAVSISAAITSFYMFRMWYMTFAGKPRDHHRYEHAHESPKVMVYPLVVLAALAIGAGWQIGPVGVENLLEQARPAGTGLATQGQLITDLRYPNEHDAHHFHLLATVVASSMALSGFLLATLFYGLKILDPNDVRRQFAPIYKLLYHKWYFDEIYNAVFIQPCFFIARRVAEFDKEVIDRFIHFLAHSTVQISKLDDLIDRYIVDGLVNWTADKIYAVAIALRRRRPASCGNTSCSSSWAPWAYSCSSATAWRAPSFFTPAPKFRLRQSSKKSAAIKHLSGKQNGHGIHVNRNSQPDHFFAGAGGLGAGLLPARAGRADEGLLAGDHRGRVLAHAADGVLGQRRLEIRRRAGLDAKIVLAPLDSFVQYLLLPGR